MALCLSGAAFAADELVTVNGKSFVLTDVSPGGSDRVLHSKDLQKGIYVRVATAPTGGTRYPGAETIVNARLVANGFKVAEKDDGSDLIVNFIGTTSILAQASDITASSFDGGKLMIKGGAAAAAFANGGAAGALGYVVGELLPIDERAGIYAMLIVGPTLHKGWFGRTAMSSDDAFNSNIEIKYQLAKNNEDQAQADVIFTKMIDLWIKKTLVLDVNVTADTSALVPASATIAGVVSEAKN